MGYRLGHIIVGFFMRLWFRLEYYGRENVPQTGGFIIAANHQSMLDPVVLALGIRQQPRFMAKAELYKNKLLGWVINSLGAFPVRRGAGEGEVIGFAIETLKAGRALMIFPEGTRSKTGEPGRAKSGASLIAYRSGADILPAGITYYNGLGFRARIAVRFGPVIKADETPVTTGALPEIKKLSRLIMERIGVLVERRPAKEIETDAD